jgi:hypothetical protein
MLSGNGSGQGCIADTDPETLSVPQATLRTATMYM